jgi:phage shock protein E
MKSWVLNNKLLIAGIIIGAVGGYMYWQQIGCNSGTCAITSKWHNSTAYGALMGGLLFSMFKREKNDNNKQ